MPRYVLPDQKDNVELFLRRTQLVEALQACAPQTFQRLEERVWPAYSRMFDPPGAVPFDRVETSTIAIRKFIDWLRGSVAAGDLLAEELHSEITQWMDEYHLQAEWMLDTVLSLMCGWGLDPAHADPYTFGPPNPAIKIGPPTDVEAPVIRLRDWDPRFESRGDARKKMLKEVEAEADAYLNSVEAAMKKAGYQETKMRFDIAHAEDFVEFQVNGKSCATIAAGREVGEKAVEQRVRRTAEALDIELRPRKR